MSPGHSAASLYTFLPYVYRLQLPAGGLQLLLLLMICGNEPLTPLWASASVLRFVQQEQMSAASKTTGRLLVNVFNLHLRGVERGMIVIASVREVGHWYVQRSEIAWSGKCDCATAVRLDVSLGTNCMLAVYLWHNREAGRLLTTFCR